MGGGSSQRGALGVHTAPPDGEFWGTVQLCRPSVFACGASADWLKGHLCALGHLPSFVSGALPMATLSNVAATSPVWLFTF